MCPCSKAQVFRFFVAFLVSFLFAGLLGEYKGFTIENTRNTYQEAKSVDCNTDKKKTLFVMLVR